MKYIFCILSFFSADAAFAQSGWFQLHPNVPGVYNDISFLTPDKGFLLTDNPSKVYATTSGGGSWQEISLTPCTSCTYHFKNIFFADKTTGYISGNSEGVVSKNIVFKTTDSGNTWMVDASSAPHPFPFPAPSDSVAFRGDRNYFEKTIDGGKSWVEVNRISDTSGRYAGFDFRDENNGVVIISSGAPLNTVAKVTTDGGVAWQYSEIELLYDYTDAYHYVKALPDSIYLIGGAGIYRSTKNGKTSTWNRVTASYSGPFTFYDAKIGYSSGYGGYVNKTNNGGATWTVQNINDRLGQRSGYYYNPWNKICSPSALTAYALADDSLLYKTTDGGGSLNDVTIADHFSPNISLAENPASKVAAFRFKPFSTDEKLEVFDLLGRNIKTENILRGTSSLNLDLHDISPGIYFCQVASGSLKMIVRE